MVEKKSGMAQIADAMARHPGKGLVIFGAGQIARSLLAELAGQGIRPLCVCDSNPALWHSNIEGIEVLSFDQARERYGEFLIYIASKRYLFEILEWLLLHEKVPAESIVNDTPYRKPINKGMGCQQLNEWCIVLNDKLMSCCSDFERNQPPVVAFDGDYRKTVDAFMVLRKKTIHELREGVLNSCTNCPYLTKMSDAEDTQIKLVNFANGGVCNLRCSYCYATFDQKVNMDFSALIDALRDAGQLSPDAVCQIAAGEIAIHPNRDAIYKAMRMFRECHIFTNATVYDAEIAAFLSSGTGKLVVSLDAGMRETYAKIKGADAFDRVQNTLRRYASESQSAIDLKYILLPGVNDNEEELDAFITFADEIRAARVIVSTDMNNPHLVGSHTIRMAEYLGQKAKEHSLVFETNSDIIKSASDIVNLARQE